MAKIISFVLCENVQPTIFRNSNGKNEIRPNIISPFNSIQPIAVPGNYSFCVFLIIDGVDKTAQNTIQIKITAPNEETVFSTGTFEVQPESVIDSNITFSLDLRNFIFLQEGNYIISVSFNNTEIYTYRFEVKKEVEL